MSKATTKQCGFFIHPSKKQYGASPDALGTAELLLELKAGAVSSEGTSISLDLFSNYFIQCQLQMVCTDFIITSSRIENWK